MAELNPDFNFQFDEDLHKQVTWVLDEAIKPNATGAQQFGTSLDYKIRQKVLKRRETCQVVDANVVEDYQDNGQHQLLSRSSEDAACNGSQNRDHEGQILKETCADTSSDTEAEEEFCSPFEKAPDGTSFEALAFSDLSLSRPLLKACAALGYKTPTPIQAACIPLALMGRDVSGSAITGSGKTAAYSLPILDRLLYRSRRVSTTYALVLTPTRELAIQVHSMMQSLAQFTDIRVALVVGGLSLQVQAVTLRTRPEVIVATPGRLIDHLRNTHSVSVDDLQTLVLDEADRLLEMGFSDEINEVLRLTPRKRQTMLFSATMTEGVKELAMLSLQKPIRLAADPKLSAPRELTQEVVRIQDDIQGAKEAVLLGICSRHFTHGRTIIFFQTKKLAHRVKMLFGLCKLPPSGELHGNMTQAMRLDSLEKFRKGEVAFLLATDVAARGLDILGVETVINFDAPSSVASYLHRIGRTARAGKAGRSITLVEGDDRKLMKQIIKQKVDLRERVVSRALVRSWTRRIESHAADIDLLVEEERVERQMRKAEMEVTKAENLIRHETEITSRPARTWFQTEADKKSGSESGNTVPQSFTKAKDKQLERNAKKRDRAQELAQGTAGKKPRLMEETGHASKKIKAMKAREAELREQGLNPAQARRLVAKSVPNKSRKKQLSDRGLFENTDVKRASGAYRPASRDADRARPSSHSSPRERSIVGRTGRGSKAFKSKSKYKRR